MQRPLVISLSEDGGFCLVLLTFLCGLVEVSNQKPKLPRKLQKTIGLGYYLPLDSINLKNTCLLCLYMKSNGPLQVDCECASCFTIIFFKAI